MGTCPREILNSSFHRVWISRNSTGCRLRSPTPRKMVTQLCNRPLGPRWRPRNSKQSITFITCRSHKCNCNTSSQNPSHARSLKAAGSTSSSPSHSWTGIKPGLGAPRTALTRRAPSTTSTRRERPLVSTERTRRS
jgi:hypothetical protein